MLADFSRDLNELLEDMTPIGGERSILQKLKKLVDFSIASFPKETLEKQFPELFSLYPHKGGAVKGSKMFSALAEGIGKRLGLTETKIITDLTSQLEMLKEQMSNVMNQRFEDNAKANMEGQAQVTCQLYDIESRIQSGFEQLNLENAELKRQNEELLRKLQAASEPRPQPPGQFVST